MEGITYISVINLSINSHQPSSNLTAFTDRAFRNFVFLKLIISEQVINYILCIEHLRTVRICDRNSRSITTA